MIDAIVQSEAPVTILGGAAFSERTLALCLSHAPLLVAADGAARAAIALGHVPAAVIGDLDSLDPETEARLPAATIHRIAEQETTDFDKALRSIAAPLVLAAGFTGRRLDHELAVYNALVRHAARPCIVVGEEDICFHAPPRLDLELETGTRVSLFPLAPVTGESEGLAWPIAGLDFDPAGRIGTSNTATGPVRLGFNGPGMLVILPRPALAAAVRALAGAPPG